MVSVTQTKPWYRSKMLWVGVITAALGVLGYLIQTQATGGLPFDIDPRLFLVAQGVLIVVLRFVTNQPIGSS